MEAEQIVGFLYPVDIADTTRNGTTSTQPCPQAQYQIWSIPGPAGELRESADLHVQPYDDLHAGDASGEGCYGTQSKARVVRAEVAPRAPVPHNETREMGDCDLERTQTGSYIDVKGYEHPFGPLHDVCVVQMGVRDKWTVNGRPQVAPEKPNPTSIPSTRHDPAGTSEHVVSALDEQLTWADLPEHLTCMMPTIDLLTPHEEHQLVDLLLDYTDIFMAPDGKVGYNN